MTITFTVAPANEAVDVEVDTNITFEVISGDGYRIDIASLNVVIDGASAILSNVVQTPDYAGTVNNVEDGYRYAGVIDPRFLFTGNAIHSVDISVDEEITGVRYVSVTPFITKFDIANPQTLYIGDEDGVKHIEVSSLSGDATAAVNNIMDGYYVNSIDPLVLNQINRLAVGTKDTGCIFYSTNYAWPTLFYSVGDEIIRASLSTANDGTLYLANRSRSRVDVYYNILYDDVGRSTPDAFYSTVDATLPDGYGINELQDGYFTDMVVTIGTSTVAAGSNSIFLGTSNGVFRVETDETTPQGSEGSGSITSYGNVGSGLEYEQISGTTNEIASIGVNTSTNHLYIATKSLDENDSNAFTYIDLATNTNSGFIPEARLISRLINDITVKGR